MKDPRAIPEVWAIEEARKKRLDEQRKELNRVAGRRGVEEQLEMQNEIWARSSSVKSHLGTPCIGLKGESMFDGIQKCSYSGKSYYWWDDDIHSTHLIPITEVHLQEIADKVLMWLNDTLVATIEGFPILSLLEYLKSRGIEKINASLDRDDVMYDDGFNPEPSRIYYGKNVSVKETVAV